MASGLYVRFCRRRTHAIVIQKSLPPLLASISGNDRMAYHRVFRKRAKRALKNNKLSLLPFRMRDVSNIWCFAKDGKVTWEYLSSHSFFRRIVTDEQLQDIIKKARKPHKYGSSPCLVMGMRKMADAKNAAMV